ARDVHEVVDRAGDVEGPQHPGEPGHLLGELLEVAAPVAAEAHGDHRLDGPPDGDGVDVGVDAAHHAALAQRADPHEAGGLGDAGLAGEHRVGHAAVLLQEPDQGEVGRVEGLGGRLRILRHGARVCRPAGLAHVSPPHDRRLFLDVATRCFAHLDLLTQYLHDVRMTAEILGLDSRAVHLGRADLTAMGVHVPPIDLSTTYPL